MKTHSRTMSCFAAGTLLIAANVSAQNYPNKPIRIITSGVGGGSDFSARVVAQGLTGPLGQPVIVDNRASNVTGEIVAKAAPDGYTLLVAGSSLWILSLLQDVPYDPIKDFAPITVTDQSPNLIVVHPSLPVRSVKELIAYAKAHPGQLNYAAASGSTQLAAELFKTMTGTNIVYIPYKNMASALNDLMSGYVTIMAGISAITPLLESGKLRAIAVTTKEPSALYPNLPTVAATVPGYEAVGVTVLMAPARTPEAIITRLNQETARFLRTPQVKEKMLANGSEPVGNSPEQLAAEMKTEMSNLTKVIKDAHLKAN